MLTRKPEQTQLAPSSLSIRRHVIAIAVVGGVLVGGIGILAAATELSGAVVSSGVVVVESNVKKVQHAAGGIVKDLLVSEGSRVTAGDVLIRLDEAVANANLAAISKSYWELQARRGRLEAERDEAQDITFAADLLQQQDDEAIAAMTEGERRLLKVRRDSATNRKKQLREKIQQLNDEISGLQDQLAAKQTEYDLIQTELVGVETLWEQKLVAITRLTSLQREAARLLGERGLLKASMAQSKGRISETELQISQIDDDARRDAVKELSEVRAKSEETFERRIAALDVSNRLEIRSPQDGTVLDLTAHTRGGVIAPGETIMMVVPRDDALIVEARIAPQDIDQVRLGQDAVLRFPNFNQRTTPEIMGSVARIGADVSRDDKANPGHFVVRIAIPAGELARLPDTKLMPGMPVEVFVRTTERTVLSYLVKPLAEQARRAFREK